MRAIRVPVAEHQCQTVMCEERYRLWAEYDRALKEYLGLMHGIVSGLFGLDEAAEIEGARSRVEKMRRKIEEHAREHNCELATVPRLEQYR